MMIPFASFYHLIQLFSGFVNKNIIGMYYIEMHSTPHRLCLIVGKKAQIAVLKLLALDIFNVFD